MFLQGIMRDGVLVPPEPWSSPAIEEEQQVEQQRRNSLTRLVEGFSQRLEEQRRAPDESIALGAASELLARLRVAGYVFTLNPGTETISVAPRPDEQIAQRLRDNKAALVRILAAEAPEQTGA